MKKILPLILVIFMANTEISFGQTNLFPSSGNVGIGTATPAARLYINAPSSTTTPAFQIASSGTLANNDIVRFQINGLTNGFRMFQDNSSKLIYSFIDGNVGIGTTAPISTLQTIGNLTVGSGTNPYAVGTMQLKSDGTSPIANRLTYGTDGTGWKFAIGKNQGGTITEQFIIADNGNVGIGTTDKLFQTLNINGGIGFANFNNTDKRLYSPIDGDLEWMTHNLAGGHGFAVSHQGNKVVYLNTLGNSYFNGGNLGIGTITPSVKLDIVGGKQRIYNTLGTNDYTNVAQHNGQFRINNGLGTLQSKTLEFALLDNGTGVIQANESGVGYNNLTLNPVSGNVGIGTINPITKLDVRGSIIAGNTDLAIGSVGSFLQIQQGASSGNTYSEIGAYSNGGNALNNLILNRTAGNVGIGTATPSQKLEIGGGRAMTFNSSLGVIKMKGDAGGWAMNYGFSGSGDADLGGLWGYGGANEIVQWSIGKAYTDNLFVVKNNGNVGIGVNPGYRFQVNGSTSGDVIGEIRNNATNGYGLRFYNGTNSNYAIAVANADGSGNTIQMFGNGLISASTINSTGAKSLFSGMDIGNPTGDNNIQIGSGNGATGNRYSYLDIVGDDTYTDYGLRLIRNNVGLNANSSLIHRGTGDLQIYTNESAPITFITATTEKMRVLANGNVGIGTTTPSAKLEIASTIGSGLRLSGLSQANVQASPPRTLGVDANGEVIVMNTVGGGTDLNTQSAPSNISLTSLEKNVLFYAHKRFKFSQSGTAKLDESLLFDASFYPSYTNTAPTETDPTVILIEDLPSYHVQRGVMIGWSTRYWPATKFKIEVFDIWNSSSNANYNKWVTIADESNFTGSDYKVVLPTATVYPVISKIRFTFYKGSGENGRLGVAELFYLHPEASQAYDGLLPKLTADGKLGIGTDTPSEKLTVYGVNNVAPSVLSLESSREDIANAEVGMVKFKNSGSDIARIGANRSGGSTTGSLNFWVKNTNETPLFEAMRISESGNVSIGTTTPFSKLHVNNKDVKNTYITTGNPLGGTIIGHGSDNEGIISGYASTNLKFGHSISSTFVETMRINANGYVGIGTINPYSKLQVSGFGISNGITLGERVDNPNTVSSALYTTNTGNGILSIKVGKSTVGYGNIALNEDGGSVSIGTTTIPTGYKLAVGGDMIAERVVVKLQSNWPDYVFKTGYTLRPLTEVENFVKVNNHLPDVPSETEIKEKGIDMEQMNATLLKKVEELTLYMIELQKQNVDLKKRMDLLEKK